MKLYAVVFGVLVACALSMALEHGPILTALQPVQEHPIEEQQLVAVGPVRQKRGLLLGAGVLGAAALGVGAAGAVGLGAGLLGAKAGFIGGALAGGALSHGRSYGGGWNYGGGYGSGYYGGGYGGGWGYGGGYGNGYYGGHGYRSYYPTTYIVSSDPWC